MMRIKRGSIRAWATMVACSPGMEEAAAKPYATVAFDERTSRVYEQH